MSQSQLDGQFLLVRPRISQPVYSSLGLSPETQYHGGGAWYRLSSRNATAFWAGNRHMLWEDTHSGEFWWSKRSHSSHGNRSTWCVYSWRCLMKRKLTWGDELNCESVPLNSLFLKHGKINPGILQKSDRAWVKFTICLAQRVAEIELPGVHTLWLLALLIGNSKSCVVKEEVLPSWIMARSSTFFFTSVYWSKLT